MKTAGFKGKFLFTALLLAILAPGLAGSFGLLGDFGRNKVRYRKFDWKTLNTEHFTIHYYQEEEALANEAAEEAERAWQMEVDYFRLIKAPQRKVPIFLYASFHDFIQTNVITETMDEGIGGFTEVFKTRVVLPLSPSPEQRRTVITHELVHAHQYVLLYGEGLKSYSLYKSILIPQWFMEGMAEHVANDWDAVGRMVLRDAVLSDRLYPLTLMHSFNHLEPHDGYLGYKAGQSAIDYMSELYGEDKVPAILKSIDESQPFSQIFQDKTGVSLQEFDKRWRTHLKEEFWSQVRGKKDAGDYGVPLTPISSRAVINSGPVPSPTEESFAFLSDRQGYRNLFVIKQGHSASPVFSFAKFDLVTSSPPSWSPDGKRIAVVVKDGPRNIIALVAARNGRVLKRLTPEFLDIGHPRFSPDGLHLAFVGFNGISGEIYVIDTGSGSLRQVTFDGTSNTAPTFSPDGKSLYYACEGTNGSILKVVDDIASDHPASRVFGLGAGIKGGHPDVSPDGKWLLYDSDTTGILNLYAAATDGSEIRQLTDVRTGIFSGRWARDGKRIVAVTMENGSQNIYHLGESLLAMSPSVSGKNPAGMPQESVPSVPAPSPVRNGPVDIPASRLAPPARKYSQGMTMVSTPERNRGTDGKADIASAPLAATSFPFRFAYAYLGAPFKSAYARPPAIPASTPDPGITEFYRQPKDTGVYGENIPDVLAIATSPTASVAMSASVSGKDVLKTGTAGSIAPGAPTFASRIAAIAPISIALSVTKSGADVTVAWDPAPVMVAGVSCYEIFRTTCPVGEIRSLAMICEPAASLYHDSGWKYDVPYYYGVRARDSAGREVAIGRAAMTPRVDIWPAPYRFRLDSQLIDLFVLVGSISIGGGTNLAGYGVLQLSDLLGNHRLSIEASAIPTWQTVAGLTYLYEGLKPAVALSLGFSENRFLFSPSLVSSRASEFPPSIAGSRGAEATIAYPLSKYTRIEGFIGARQITEIFTDRQGYQLYDAVKSTVFPASLSYVRDTSRWRRLLPIGGYCLRVGGVSAIPASHSLRYTEYNGEVQWYMGLLEDVSFATRWFGVTSHGKNGRTYFLGGRYLLRAMGFASVRGSAGILGNNEIRANLFKHLNFQLPLLSILLTDVQGVCFLDVGSGFDPGHGPTREDMRPASLGGGLNLIGFVLQMSPVVFSIEVARRIDERQIRPTVYGRLGTIF